MGSQIIFFQKNQADYRETSVSATASEASDLAAQALNRSNLSAWITTGSVDVNDTTWTVDLSDPRIISEILLIKHNFKEFEVKYWDGAAYQHFSPPINETVNAEVTSWYSVATVSTSKIRITIYGTQVADSDKELFQFIATSQIGQLNAWPVIKNPTISRNRKRTSMLSGKLSVAENVGAFSCELSIKSWSNDDDLTLFERLYDSSEGFLVWLCGGDEAQFKTRRQGYRLEDLYLMKCTDEYVPELVEGIYQNGLSIKVNLSEVID